MEQMEVSSEVEVSTTTTIPIDADTVAGTVADTVADTVVSIIEPTNTVVTEVKEVENVGKYTGQCKWFNDKLGYGFVTICDGDDKGKDIFVHHSGINPLNSNYKTLRKGEYIQYDIIDGMNGLQAVNVRGIGGGPLMCDFVSTRKAPFITGASTNNYSSQNSSHTSPNRTGSPHRTGGKQPQWQVVTRKAKYSPKGGYQGGGGGVGNQGSVDRPAKRSYRQAMV